MASLKSAAAKSLIGIVCISSVVIGYLVMLDNTLAYLESRKHESEWITSCERRYLKNTVDLSMITAANMVVRHVGYQIIVKGEISYVSQNGTPVTKELYCGPINVM